MASVEIDGRPIGGSPPRTFVIAELSANHGGSLDTALGIVRAAAEAGADAIKLQTYRPDTITIDADTEPFRISSGTVWDGRTMYELYEEAHTPWEWHAPIRDEALRLGMTWFSSPFDATAIDLLESLDVPAYKIASFEIVDVGLIRRVAATGKPMVISTGMATYDEIEEAVAAARDGGATDIALLKCTSAYPAPPDEVDLRTIPHMATAFGVPVGLSDHTMGIAVPVAAVALGAVIVEKHVTLRRADGGPDSGFSLEPAELAEMVAQIRVAEQALGSVSYTPTEREAPSRSLRRSLFVVDDVRAGEPFTEANVRSIRPGHGLHTRHLPEILGRHAARDVARGTPLSWDLIAPA
ncbi:MAG TPA: pseudaminic acid synthase [Candidatus Limnocylindria bacterium]|nr:pseudaminic acid synthase [Candidatus Limnocylindria bacterium]